MDHALLRREPLAEPDLAGPVGADAPSQTSDLAAIPRRAQWASPTPRLHDEIVRVETDPVPPLPRTAPGRPVVLAPLPELIPSAVPGLAWIAGRAVIGVAVAGAAHRVHVTASHGRTVLSSQLELAVMIAAALLGIVATVWWSGVAAVNTRRLGLPTPRLATAVTSWLLPIAWLPTGTALMGLKVRAEVDPMPALAIGGLALALAVPYLVTADMTRVIGRSRPLGRWWATMWFADVLIVGLAWYALVVHSSGTSWPTWPATAAALAAAGSVVPLLVALVIATRIPRLARRRLAHLEHERTVAADPTWFRTGFVGRSNGRAPVALLRTERWGSAAAVAFGAWACAASVAAVVASSETWFAGSAPTGYLHGVAAMSLGAGGVAMVLFACWATLTAVNARRARPVGSVTPTLPVVLGVPAPVALWLGVSIGGDTGWTIAAVGLVVAGSAAMVSLRALGGIAVTHRAPSVGFRAWGLVMGLAVASSAGTFLTVGTPDTPWSSIGLAHLFVVAHIATLATMAVLASRTTSALDARLAESAG